MFRSNPGGRHGRGNYIQRIDEIAETLAASLKQIGLPNVRINLPEAQIFQDIMRQKPVPPDRGMIVIHTSTATS